MCARVLFVYKPAVESVIHRRLIYKGDTSLAWFRCQGVQYDMPVNSVIHTSPGSYSQVIQYNMPVKSCIHTFPGSYSQVIQYDMPVKKGGGADPETYLHRVGRTGRFGRPGRALAILGTNEELKVYMFVCGCVCRERERERERDG